MTIAGIKNTSAVKNFPFSAIVGQDDMKLALMIAAVEPKINGVLVFGDRGTGKSTTIRSLAQILQQMPVVSGCAYNCDPRTESSACPAEHDPQQSSETLVSVPVVDLPLGATEDRIVGALNLEHALAHGKKKFEPGLLAKAHRGFLYIDEVNLLEDHLVDLLLDVSASGENIVEREGLSIRHDSRFVLVGSGNPEEGELRPQLLDRFGLSVDVKTPSDIDERIEIVRRRDAFEQNAAEFYAQYSADDDELRGRISTAAGRIADIEISETVLKNVTELCVALETDGLRGELTLLKAARAFAALEGCEAVKTDHIRRVAPMSLQHRLRRDPLDESASKVRVEKQLAEMFGPSQAG